MYGLKNQDEAISHLYKTYSQHVSNVASTTHLNESIDGYHVKELTDALK